MSTSVYAAIATIIAAFIAGSISFINIILSKEQKTSEFRQSWIDGLRDDISEFISRIEVVSALLCHLDQPSSEPDRMSRLIKESEELREAATRYYRIKLRLNPIKHKKLIENVDEVFDIVSDPSKSQDRLYVGTCLTKLVNEGQIVLKNEWTRVKKGETPFRLIKMSSLLFVTALIITFVAILTILLGNGNYMICSISSFLINDCLTI